MHEWHRPICLPTQSNKQNTKMTPKTQQGLWTQPSRQLIVACVQEFVTRQSSDLRFTEKLIVLRQIQFQMKIYLPAWNVESISLPMLSSVSSEYTEI